LIRFSIFALRCKQFKTAVIFSIQTSMLGWSTLFERRRRTVLGASMMAVNGRARREGEVVHLIAQQLFDPTSDLSGVADRDETFKLPTGRGDEFAYP
jgi:hypothetical protein